MLKQALIIFLLSYLQQSFCTENYHLYCECKDADVSSIGKDKTYCQHWECDQKAHSASCFPANAFLLKSDGSQVIMNQLSHDMKIMTRNAETGELIEDQIIGFLHKNSTQNLDYLRIKTTNAEIDISEMHLIYGRKYKNAKSDYIFAEKLEIGDEIFITEWEQILTIEKNNLEGVYAPLTSTGTMLVNNVLVSCYANLENQFVSQLSFMPYRYLQFFLKYFTNEEQQKAIAEYEVDGIHWYANILMKISKFMPESLNYEIQSNKQTKNQ